MPKPEGLEVFAEITEASSRLARALGDDPVAIAEAVAAELELNGPAGAEHRQAIEDLLRQSYYVERLRHLM